MTPSNVACVVSTTGSEESRSLLIQSHTRPLPLGGESDPEADQDAAGPAHETARQPRPPEHAAGISAGIPVKAGPTPPPGQLSEAGSPNGVKWSGPRNEVISAIRSPRRVSTVIDHASCGLEASAPR